MTATTEERCTATTKAGRPCRNHRLEPFEVCRAHAPEDQLDTPVTPPQARPRRRLAVAAYPGDEDDPVPCSTCGGIEGLPVAAVGVYDVAAPGGDQGALCWACLTSDDEGRVMARWLACWESLVAALPLEDCDALAAFVRSELDPSAASVPEERR